MPCQQRQLYGVEKLQPLGHPIRQTVELHQFVLNHHLSVMNRTFALLNKKRGRHILRSSQSLVLSHINTSKLHVPLVFLSLQ